mmetsp:Transcript_42325/g.99298  ORF Transcript_42325/g.99298 Transcript_42325/m.99298 type:complete len:216 (-) Transcript_42325:2921-3568(-)
MCSLPQDVNIKLGRFDRSQSIPGNKFIFLDGFIIGIIFYPAVLFDGLQQGNIMMFGPFVTVGYRNLTGWNDSVQHLSVGGHNHQFSYFPHIFQFFEETLFGAELEKTPRPKGQHIRGRVFFDEGRELRIGQGIDAQLCAPLVQFLIHIFVFLPLGNDDVDTFHDIFQFGMKQYHIDEEALFDRAIFPFVDLPKLGIGHEFESAFLFGRVFPPAHL